MWGVAFKRSPTEIDTEYVNVALSFIVLDRDVLTHFTCVILIFIERGSSTYSVQFYVYSGIVVLQHAVVKVLLHNICTVYMV